MPVVQPYDAERRPTACAIRIGPILSEAAVAAVEGWVRGARLDPRLLPAHLVQHRNTLASTRN